MPRNNRSSQTTAPFRFDPNSLNAQLATILAEAKAGREETMTALRAQNVELAEIKAEAKKTNGRVTLLERWRDSSKAKIAGISLVVGLVGGALTCLAEILYR